MLIYFPQTGLILSYQLTKKQ